ncbi:hypothetical protein E0Z10_g10606 [Xylaria hypoxylon]|uniref:1-alkyl-2-acetylglycerophosphocholine esterase n=1 Tax=Xylaria hypoxylon TaxID=37992 RepID=A0A4Z0YKK0_9PEZI|nr:hypothetical protein E0Z10_g10606 [Xylaria hypoxylon]
MSALRKIVLSLAVLREACGAIIPPPTGQFSVSRKKVEIPYVNTGDPIAPNNVTTAFLATVYYPTSERFMGPPVPYLDPALAALFEGAYNVTAGSFANLTTNAIVWDAPLLNGTAYPTLLFGPAGIGPPVEMFSILLSDLASYGYTVIGADHPYEQPFIRWPNGTALYGLPPFDSPDIDSGALVDIRVNETKALIDNIPLIEQCLGGIVNSTHIGTFGHSAGGSAAARALLQENRVSSAVNIDGPFLDEDQYADAVKPIFLLSEEVYEDPSWVHFAPEQTGLWKHLGVNGSLHVDFTDLAFWKEVTDVKAHSSSLGDINGYRQVNITRTFVRSFFDFTLRGVPEPIFDGPSDAWPEVVYITVENSTSMK